MLIRNGQFFSYLRAQFTGVSKSYAASSLVSIGSYAITSILTLGFGIMAARALGPDGNGELSLLLVVLSTVTVLINVGFGQIAVFSINQNQASAQSVASELWTTAWIWGGFTAIGILIGGSLWNLVSPGTFSPLLIGVAVLLTPPLLAKHYAEYLFVSLHRFGWLGVVLASELALRLALFGVLMRWPGGVEGAILTVVIAALGSTALGWGKLIGILGAPRITLRLPTLQPLFSYGMVNYISVLFAHLNLRVDQFLIAAVLPVRELGVYVTAVTLAELPIKIATALSKLVFVSAAALSASDANRLTSATLRIVITLAWMLAAVVWLFRAPIVEVIYGPGYAGAELALAWLLPGAALFSYVQILGSHLAGRGYPRACVLAGAAGLVTGVVANLTLTPHFGIAGAAMSTSLGYAVSSAVVLFSYCKLTGQSPTLLVVATWPDVRMIVGRLRPHAARLNE